MWTRKRLLPDIHCMESHSCEDLLYCNVGIHGVDVVTRTYSVSKSMSFCPGGMGCRICRILTLLNVGYVTEAFFYWTCEYNEKLRL